MNNPQLLHWLTPLCVFSAARGIVQARRKSHRHFPVKSLSTRSLADAQDLEGNHLVEFIGKGTDSIAIDELPGYPNLVRDLATERNYDIDTFDVWRVKLEFPVYQSSSCIFWKTDAWKFDGEQV